MAERRVERQPSLRNESNRTHLYTNSSKGYSSPVLVFVLLLDYRRMGVTSTAGYFPWFPRLRFALKPVFDYVQSR